MSFLADLKSKKSKLKGTETIVTTVDGQRYIQSRDKTVPLPSTHGFVVDTKPDNIPVLITDYLYIGSQDCTASNVLSEYNIKHVLSLGIDVETSVASKFVQCLDLPETDIKPVLKEGLPFIRRAVESMENVLVHCNAGVSRTSMVGIAYLMVFEGMGYEDAYNLLKLKRPAIQPNDGFRRQLKTLKVNDLL